MVNGVVYVGSDDGKVYALNAATGAKMWSYTTDDYVSSSPAVVNGVVYVGSGLKDGNSTPSTPPPGPSCGARHQRRRLSSPAVANGVVYVGSDDGKVTP